MSPKFLKGVREKFKRKLTAKQRESFKTIYATYFYAINGFATGSPSKLQRLAMRYYVAKSIDSKYNKDAKKHCIVLSRKKVLTDKDIGFVNEELLPYVSASLWKDLEMLPEDLDIDARVTEKAFRKNLKNKEKFRVKK